MNIQVVPPQPPYINDEILKSAKSGLANFLIHFFLLERMSSAHAML